MNMLKRITMKHLTKPITNNMTPKEKATYLVFRYMSKVVSKKVAIECAIVAVQEIICSNPHSNPLNTNVTSTMKWWMDVQEELEKK
jgi:hypothetical protein